MKKSYEMKLGASIFKVSTDADDVNEAWVRRVEKFANERLSAAAGRSKASASQAHLALLALLDLSEEYLKSKERVAAYQEKIQKEIEVGLGNQG